MWEERPGTLVWVGVPSTSNDKLLTIAEGVRRLDGPASIPHVVVVSGSSPWSPDGNDADGLVSARIGGQPCVGFGWVETCGTDIAASTITRDSWEAGGDVIVAGATPADVVQARIDLDGGDPVVVDTITSGSDPRRFFVVGVPNEFLVRGITWLDAEGNAVASTPLEVVPADAAE